LRPTTTVDTLIRIDPTAGDSRIPAHARTLAASDRFVLVLGQHLGEHRAESMPTDAANNDATT